MLLYSLWAGEERSPAHSRCNWSLLVAPAAGGCVTDFMYGQAGQAETGSQDET